LQNIGAAAHLLTFAALITVPFVARARGTLDAYNPVAATLPAITLLSLDIFGKMALGALSGFDYVAILAGECKHAASSIGRAVLVGAPVVALMFILGTSSTLALVPKLGAPHEDVRAFSAHRPGLRVSRRAGLRQLAAARTGYLPAADVAFLAQIDRSGVAAGAIASNRAATLTARFAHVGRVGFAAGTIALHDATALAAGFAHIGRVDLAAGAIALHDATALAAGFTDAGKGRFATAAVALDGATASATRFAHVGRGGLATGAVALDGATTVTLLSFVLNALASSIAASRRLCGA